jgi:hypothetical protein
MSLEKTCDIVTRREVLAAGLAVSGLPFYAIAAAAVPQSEDSVMSNTSSASTKTLRDAWRTYNAAVERARLAMEATPRFKDRTDHRATAYHSLAEAQSMAYSFAVAPHMDCPVINTRAWYHDVHTLGGTSADLYHVSASVDGRHTYRLFGRVGDLKILLIQVFNTILGGAGQKQLVDADIATMADANGNFEVILSAKSRQGNWLPLDPNSEFNFLFIRRFFDDAYSDRGTLDIELLDGPVDNNELDEAAMARRILLAADSLIFLVEKWNIGVYDLYLSKNDGKKNSLAVVPGSEIASGSAGSPKTIYTWGIFDIQDDEALVVEFEAPKAAFWSVQIQDVWTKPINYLNHQSDINQRHAVIDRDGKFRVVICLKDPGVANWLDSDGRKEGTIVGRAYIPQATPSVPIVKRIKFKDIRKHLPVDTKHVTQKQREEALKLRRNGLLKMFGDT